jgi:hypothetical protein
MTTNERNATTEEREELAALAIREAVMLSVHTRDAKRAGAQRTLDAALERWKAGRTHERGATVRMALDDVEEKGTR